MFKIPLLIAIFPIMALADDVAVTAIIKDEFGLPISNAVVSVSTQKMLMFGYGSHPDHFSWASNQTDQAGVAVVKFKCCTADFSCFVCAGSLHASNHNTPYFMYCNT